MEKFAKPNDSENIYTINVMELMPSRNDIPDEFKKDRNEWVKWQQQWFFNGLEKFPEPKEGIDMQLAIRHLQRINSSWTPKHEHKEAGVAYLASLWFVKP